MRFSIRRRHNNLRVICVMLLAVLIGAPFFLRAAQVSAGVVSWMESEPALKSTRPLDPAKDPNAIVRGDCVLETVEVVKTYQDKKPTRSVVLCLNEANGWRFGQENGSYDVYASDGGLFYKVRNLSAVHHFKGTDTIMGMHRGHAFDYDEISHLKKYDNFTKRLKLSEDKKSFEFDQANPLFSLERNGKPSYAISWGVSNNGRYLVYSHSARNVNAYDIFSRVDMETGEKKVFGRGYYEHTHNREPQPGVVVSNDGDQVVISGVASFKVWRLTPECLIDYDQMKDEFRDPCLTRTITPTFYDEKWKGLEASHERLRVNDAFTELTYQHRALRGGPPSEVVTISIAKQEPETPRLDYLALGDSYSSGEGDIKDGFSEFYIKDTGSPKDCHLSSRSYPYVLAGRKGIQGVQSVACSGARMIHDYVMNPRYYTGQNEVTQKIIKEKGAARATSDALAAFLPGYIPQLEFVKKYQPQTITLTGGGNDVGFGDVLKTCLLDTGTCSYADNPEVILATNNLVYNQYGAARIVIKKLQQASPRSKIFIIGYPQFIDDTSDKCEGVGFLNKAERRMIRQHTSRLNNVLKRAARDSGVQYVSVEQALRGGRLCENKKYVTSLADVGIAGFAANAVQNAFHPNATGHALMAKAIDYEMSKSDQESKPGVEGEPQDKPKEVTLTKRLDMSDAKDIRVNGNIPVHISGEGLAPGSTLTAKLFSKPTALPSLTVNGKGDVSGKLKLPEGIGAGHHTLLTRGITASGREIVFLSTIFVKGVDGDEDGDGIPDVSDRCAGMPPIIKEGKDICSAGVNDKQPAASSNYSHKYTTEMPRSASTWKASAILTGGAALALVVVIGLIIKIRRS
ncbi:MAG: SGNH/GDSL hydrolase family protein [Candidatus Saccharibacteria bacterium]|nr:SGNH/GDSL hydrolase family protein [Candidatus Saccharibacteria bacterium]